MVTKRYLSRFMDGSDRELDLLQTTRILTIQAMLLRFRYALCHRCFLQPKIESATFESVAFRLIVANDHPDHYNVAAFRAVY
jgi:hypothetical protein